jgi:hypothetical protein
VNLNFKSKDEVLKLRAVAVERHPDLFVPPYTPTDAVFGQITAGKAWWGLDGLYHFGPGNRSIEGPSAQTRFFLNPFLLVGVSETNAFVVPNPPPGAADYYPHPIGLQLIPGEARAEIRYAVKPYFAYVKHINAKLRHALELIAYNARDFGFAFLTIESASKGVRAEVGKIVHIPQYIHTGGSCGYPSGCNNMSPTEPNFQFDIDTVPSEMTINLFKQQPAKDAKPDFTVHLRFS